MGKKQKTYKSLGLKRTWALSIGASAILGGLGSATILTRYFGSASVASNAQIDDFWNTVQDNSASFFVVSSTNNKDGEATFQFQESTFLNFIERNHIKDNFIIELHQGITFENSEGEPVTQEWTTEYTKDNLNELSRSALYKDASFEFKFQIQDGEWQEITSPFDRQNFEHPTGIRAPIKYSVTGIEDNTSVYALVAYPNELFATIDSIVDLDNPTDQDMHDVANIILSKPQETVYNANTFSMVRGAFDTSIWVDVYFKKSEYDGAGYLFNQENIDKYFVAGEEYTLWLQLNPNATNYSDIRLESDTDNKYKEFKFKADPTDWVLNWDNSAVKGKIREAIQGEIADVSTGYFDAMTIDLDTLKHEVKSKVLLNTTIETGHSFDWLNLNLGIEIMNGTNGDLFELSSLNFKVIDLNNDFNTPEIEIFGITLPEGEKRDVAIAATAIYNLIQDAFDSYAVIKQGISGYWADDLSAYLELPSTHEIVWEDSEFEAIKNGDQISFTFKPIYGYVFNASDHDLPGTVDLSGTGFISVTIDVDNLLIPINTVYQWVSELDQQSSYVGFESGDITLTDAAFTATSSIVQQFHYTIGKDLSFDYTTLSLGDTVPVILYANNGYTFTRSSQGNPQFENQVSFEIENLDYDANKVQIHYSAAELSALLSLLVQDANNWSGNYSGVMTFVIPDILTGENFSIQMREPGGSWTRTLRNVSNSDSIEFKIVANHGYTFSDTSVTQGIITVFNYIQHDENIDVSWDTTKVWEYLSGGANLRTDLTIDLDAIARNIFGNNAIVAMDLANGTLAADLDRPTFTITAKDGFYLSSQAIYPNIDISAFVEAPRIDIGAIDQALWDALITFEFYSKYRVSGADALEDSLPITSELQALGVDSVFIEHENKAGESSNRVYNGQTLKITLAPHRDYQFATPTDAEYSFTVTGLKYYLDSPSILQTYFEQQYNNSIVMNADADENHRANGTYKISADQLLITEFASIDGISTVLINGSTNYDNITAGINTITFNIDGGNDYYFYDSTGETKTASIDVQINELPIKDAWKTPVIIDDTTFQDMQNTLLSNITGVNGYGNLNYSAVITSLETSYPEISFRILRNDVIVHGDLSDVSNTDEMKIRMSIGEWFKFQVTSGLPIAPAPDNPEDRFFISNTELDNPIARADIEDAMNDFYSNSHIYHIGGFPILGNMEYDIDGIKAKILNNNNLQNSAIINSLIFKDASGNVITNGNLSNGFTVEVSFLAQTGYAIVDSSGATISTLILQSHAITNDTKVEISTIDLSAEANKMALTINQISTSLIDFNIEYDGTVIDPNDTFNVEIEPGVFAQIQFIPPSNTLVGDWTTYILRFVSLSGANAHGYEWTGGAAFSQSFNSSTIAGYQDIYDIYIISTQLYSDITNTSEQEIIFDSSNTITGQGRIDGTVLSHFNALLGSRATLSFWRVKEDGTSGYIDPNTYDVFANGDTLTIEIIANPGFYIYTSRNADGTFNVTDEVLASQLSFSTMKSTLPSPEIDKSTTIPTIEGFELQTVYSAYGTVSYYYKPVGNVEFTNMFDVEVSGGTGNVNINGQEITVRIFYKSFGGFKREQANIFTFNASVTSSDTNAAKVDLFAGDTFTDANGNDVPYTQALLEMIDHQTKTAIDYQNVSSSLKLQFGTSNADYGLFGFTGSRLEVFAELFDNKYNYKANDLSQEWSFFLDEIMVDGRFNTSEISSDYERIVGANRSFEDDLILLSVITSSNSQTHENIIQAKDALWFAQEVLFEKLIEENFNQSGILNHTTYGQLANWSSSTANSLKSEVEQFYNSQDSYDETFFSSIFTENVSGTGTSFDGMNVGNFLSQFFSNYEEWFGRGVIQDLNISNRLPNSNDEIIRFGTGTNPVADYLENHSFYLSKEVEIIFGLLLGNGSSHSFAPYLIDKFDTKSDWSNMLSDTTIGWGTFSMHRGLSRPLYLQMDNAWWLQNSDPYETWRNMVSGPFATTVENHETMTNHNYGKALLEWMDTIDRSSFANELTFNNKVHAMFEYLTNYEVGYLSGDNPVVFISSGGRDGNTGAITTTQLPGLMSLSSNNPSIDISDQPVRDESDIAAWVNDLISSNLAFFMNIELNQVANDYNRTSTTSTGPLSNSFANEQQVLRFTDFTSDIYKK